MKNNCVWIVLYYGGVHIKLQTGIEFKFILVSFGPREQSMERCLYYRGVLKERFKCVFHVNWHNLTNK